MEHTKRKIWWKKKEKKRKANTLKCVRSLALCKRPTHGQNAWKTAERREIYNKNCISRNTLSEGAKFQKFRFN